MFLQCALSQIELMQLAHNLKKRDVKKVINSGLCTVYTYLNVGLSPCHGNRPDAGLCKKKKERWFVTSLLVV